ncbi:MAG: hypothetical protein J3R72DRAFT_499483 [Linnemannia gamsii]|nr:MAG: hypothetical protein J3R72DRAFT_499483 [Linnemannia gamsii]
MSTFTTSKKPLQETTTTSEKPLQEDTLKSEKSTSDRDLDEAVNFDTADPNRTNIEGGAFNPVLMSFNSPDSLSPFGSGGINTVIALAIKLAIAFAIVMRLFVYKSM